MKAVRECSPGNIKYIKFIKYLTADSIEWIIQKNKHHSKKSKGSKMSNGDRRFKGFVSGSKEERKEQESKIKKFFEGQGLVSKSLVSKTGNNAETGIEGFSSKWDKINEDLESGDFIIIADLTDLSGNLEVLEVLAKKLLIPLDKGIQVQPANEEQRKSLKWEETWNKHLGDYKEYKKLLGKLDAEKEMLRELMKWLKQIFQDTESQENLKKNKRQETPKQ